uniref:Photosystem I subunit XII n=1 Tax=Zamia fischeri TaxID=34342 RepID=A0A8F3BBI7_ZAMFI|nr:photosystem I subunit XII [Zamia fischeri]
MDIGESNFNSPYCCFDNKYFSFQTG